MRNKPFDLEKALAGEPVKLRNGLSAYVIADLSSPQKQEASAFLEANHLIGFAEDNPIHLLRWDLNGENEVHADKSYSIIEMWQEPRPRVQLDLPAPLKSLEGLNEVYCPILDEDSIGCVFSRVLIFGKNIFQDIRVQGQLDHGNLFPTKEDAQEWLDAMRNARR